MSIDQIAGIRVGVKNLVANCLETGRGQTVLLLNGRSDIEPELVGLIEDAIREQGGTPYSLWIDPLPRDISGIPRMIGNAINAADKLLLNVNLNRVLLLDHLQGNGMLDLVRVNNRLRTPDRFSTEHAQFHWGLVMAMARQLEEITASASEYTITTPRGTSMHGRVISGSEVADAFFAQDANLGRTERVFPGEVYSPVGSGDANGTIVFDHPGLADKDPWDIPLVLQVKDNFLTDVEWREETSRTETDDWGVQTIWSRDQFVGLLKTNAERYGQDAAYTVDSWHGGMHPKAVLRPGQLSETKTMHFHIGRVADTLSAYMTNQTVSLDGKVLFENGNLSLLDDPEIQELAQEFGQQI